MSVVLDDYFASNLVPASIAKGAARQQLANMRGGNFGYKTGIAPFDAMFRLVPTDVVAIGGRAASGKSAMGMQIVYNVARQLRAKEEQGTIAVFSAEMSGAALMMREACAYAQVPYQKLLLGSATPEEYDRVDTALGNREQAERLYIDETSSPTLEHMTEQLHLLSKVDQVRLIMFDYLELAGESGYQQSDRVSKIAKGMKQLAKHFQCPVVVLAQLNRDIERRAEKKPQLADFMHGGEQAYDIAIALLRPWLYDQAQPKELVEAHIVKYRNGRPDTAKLMFDEQTLRFSTAIIVRKDLNNAFARME